MIKEVTYLILGMKEKKEHTKGTMNPSKNCVHFKD
jgi:hypothetical protein